jgi:hypothetical protein
MTESAYAFKQLPLTPAIIESLTAELFGGQLAERQTIVEEVTRIHLSRGGKPGDVQSTTASVKKALNNMLQRGLAENPSRGHWRIRASELQATVPTAQIGDTDVTVVDESAASDFRLTASLSAEQTLGSGTGAIYVYYLPTYRRHAHERGEGVWPCKIGRTDRDPLERILAQAATALPERPIVSVVLRTSNPIAWEAALHGILTIRGLRMKDSPGSEWFLTSPEQLLELMHIVDPKLAQGSDSDLAPLQS